MAIVSIDAELNPTHSRKESKREGECERAKSRRRMSIKHGCRLLQREFACRPHMIFTSTSHTHAHTPHLGLYQHMLIRLHKIHNTKLHVVVVVAVAAAVAVAVASICIAKCLGVVQINHFNCRL